MIIGDAINVLRAGHELQNAETWKKRQALTATLFTLLSSAAGAAAFLGYPIPLPTDQDSLEGIASLLGMVCFGLFQLWATFATTSRIGLPAKPEDRSPGVADGSGDRTVSGEWIRELDDRNFDPLSDLKDRG